MKDAYGDDIVKNEQVKHPSYYGGEHAIYEVIKVLEAWMPEEQFIGYLRGSALVYIARAGNKPGEDVQKDLAKAAFYINYEIDYRRRSAKGHVGEARGASIGHEIRTRKQRLKANADPEGDLNND